MTNNENWEKINREAAEQERINEEKARKANEQKDGA